MANTMRPKTFGRKSAVVKPRRSTIEAVVSTIIPFMETEPSTGSTLLGKQVEADTTQRNMTEKCGLNKR